jgi:hypothetical protein
MTDILDKIDERINRADHGVDRQMAREARAEIEKLRAENERLRAALEEIRDLPGEINTGNYNHDDAVRLNDAFIETYHIARAALEEK